MLRVASVSMTVVLAVASGGVAYADEPSPAVTGDDQTEVAGQRVEVPDPGVAVTVPPDWTVEDTYGEVVAFGPEDVACRPVGSRLDEPVDDPDALVDEVAAFWPHFADNGPMPVVDEAVVMLPAGRSVRLVADLALHPDEDQMEEGRFVTTYFLSNGQVLAFLVCSGDVRPDDDWRSIAETFEFLPTVE